MIANSDIADIVTELLSDREVRYTAGDGIDLVATVFEPGARGFLVNSSTDGSEPELPDAVPNGTVTFHTTMTIQRPQRRVLRQTMRFKTQALEAEAPSQGTVVLLHGFQQDRHQTVLWGLQFADRGWHAVLPDLRGHGHSGGDVLTWGYQDARDLAILLDALEHEALLKAPVIAVGFSYGGAAALHFADLDARVQAVVTISAFANPADAIRDSRRLFGRVGFFVPKRSLDKGIRRASKRVGHDLDAEYAPEQIIGGLEIPVLILHGADDSIVPPKHAMRLHAASNGAEIVLLEDIGHFTLNLRQDVVTERMFEWLDRVLLMSR